MGGKYGTFQQRSLHVHMRQSFKSCLLAPCPTVAQAYHYVLCLTNWYLKAFAAINAMHCHGFGGPVSESHSGLIGLLRTQRNCKYRCLPNPNLMLQDFRCIGQLRMLRCGTLSQGFDLQQPESAGALVVLSVAIKALARQESHMRSAGRFGAPAEVLKAGLAQPTPQHTSEHSLVTSCGFHGVTADVSCGSTWQHVKQASKFKSLRLRRRPHRLRLYLGT